MKKALIKTGSIVVASICFVLILCQIIGFVIINSNGSRSVIIEDSNKQVIETLIFKNIESEDTLLCFDDAISVEWQSTMHKDQIVINYKNKDSSVFYITDRYQNTLIEYIKNNGKVIYFESNKFVIDLVKISLYSFLLIFAIVILVRQKSKIVQ